MIIASIDSDNVLVQSKATRFNSKFISSSVYTIKSITLYINKINSINKIRYINKKYINNLNASFYFRISNKNTSHLKKLKSKSNTEIESPYLRKFAKLNIHKNGKNKLFSIIGQRKSKLEEIKIRRKNILEPNDYRNLQ